MEKEQVVTLIDAFKDFKEEKNIDRPVMMGVLKDVFLTQIAKTYGSSDNFDVIVNVDKGTCEIYQNFEIVEEVTDPNAEMTPEQVAALTGDDDYEVGDTYTKKFNLQDFGRRGILNIRQNLQGRIMPTSSRSIPRRSARSSRERSTRPGPRKSSSSTRTATSSTSRAASRSPASISRRVTPSAPSSRTWR